MTVRSVSGSSEVHGGIEAPLPSPSAETVSFATSAVAQKSAFTDAMQAKPTSFGKMLNGPSAIAKAPLFPHIAESFPIGDLSLIEGAGVVGSKFMLDGGCLAGLQLWARRFVDGDEKGFELNMRLIEKFNSELLEKMKAHGAKWGSLSFPEIVRDDQGVAHFVNRGVVSKEAARKNYRAVCSVLNGVHGSTVELTEPTIAMAARGLMRIRLRGNDAECTKQLTTFIKQLGLEELFAPPTPKSKERLMLMRVLWQADAKTADALSKDLSAVKVDDLKSRLKELGYDDARLAGLTWQEVYPGHFTGIDRAQKEQMIAAGARYLYASLTRVEGVLNILQVGQKASMRRYQEGLIVNGISTKDDFLSGGALGVFTRLVTQNAISSGVKWRGGLYKIMLSPELLARTDWYGWSDDRYGQSYGLAGDTNFGVPLVRKIDAGYFKEDNELIFRTGIAPEHILNVVASDEADRRVLIDYLRDNHFEPRDGRTLEELVLCDPKFLQYGSM